MVMKTKVKNRLIIFLTMIIVIIGGLFWLPWDEAKQKLVVEDKQKKIEMQNPFKDIEINGYAAIVLNADTGEIIFAKNETEQMPLASITKVMTALVASETLSKDAPIIVDYEALKEGSNAGLSPSRWSLKNLLDFSLVTSSNGGARAIAMAYAPLTQKGDFISQMNQEAKTIGLDSTYFINPTGLDIDGSYGGSYGTALDVARLFRYVITEHPALLSATRETEVRRSTTDGRIYLGYNTNQIVNQVPGLFASKTGFTDNAGGNLAIAFDAGLREPYIAVVLGSSKEKRFSDIKTLTDTTIKYLTTIQ